jgi:rhamnulokinase
LARHGVDLDYATLTRFAGEAMPLRTVLNPGHAAFQSPGGMLEKMREFARMTSQPIPDVPGEFVRAALESLALAYREKLLALEAILERHFDVIHIVGGGGKNSLLSQMTADATGRRVVVGPYEATAMGNALVQAMATGQVRDLAHLRRIVASSTELDVYEPSSSAGWDDAYQRYCQLAAS